MSTAPNGSTSASGDLIRFDATVASIAEALKTLGDTDASARRRAKAIGIIADPAYTEELLRQARTELLAQTEIAPERAPQAAPAPNAAEAEAGTEAAPGPHPEPEHGPAPEPEPVFGPEPGPDDEADRDAPHPSHSDLPDPLDTPTGTPGEPRRPGPRVDPDAADPAPGEPLDTAAQRAFDARLAQIKHDAHAAHAAHAARAAAPGAGADSADSAGRAGGRVRPEAELYVHLTDHTLATGDGILRVERLGPLLASQLAELVGHGPYIVKPVIDLNDAIAVDCYEIPDRIRERVKLIHPVEQFPYGTRETDRGTDLDHIHPYDPLGPPGQTGTENLAPLRRYAHRVKTHGRWKVKRLDRTTLEWTTPHGYRFHVTPTGTYPVTDPTPDT